jgi:hypothetical protein
MKEYEVTISYTVYSKWRGMADTSEEAEEVAMMTLSPDWADSSWETEIIQTDVIPPIKYKIQVPCVTSWGDTGWSDLRDDGEDRHYDTKEEACAEAAQLLLSLENFELRVVTADTPEDCNLYK